ncbi:putative nucleotidyltransferase [Dysgonomonadaceae bacterium PH5-43]|nr:putative nucleotidyltransferase [Dysgonomonadaceae bacterium PH5-43]
MKYGLKEETIIRIQKVFSQYPQIEQAIIYGSRAMGNYKPASDIDIAFVGENLSLDIISKIEWDLDDLLLPYTFDLSVYNKITNPDVQNHINRVGKIFYNKSQYELFE